MQELLNTVAFFCSALALAAFAVGAALWAIGGRMMHSSGGAAMGKMTMLAAAGGAILLGAGPGNHRLGDQPRRASLSGRSR